MKNLKIENAKAGGNKQPQQQQPQNQKGVGNSQKKGGGGGLPQGMMTPQMQQMKVFQDLKQPPPQFMKDMKLKALNNHLNQKAMMKSNLVEDEGLNDDYDDYDDDYTDDDEENDELNDAPHPNKMKPMMGTIHLRYDGAQSSRLVQDPVHVPVGLVTRARAKKFNDDLMGLVHEVWSQELMKRPIEVGGVLESPSLINMIEVDEWARV